MHISLASDLICQRSDLLLEVAIERGASWAELVSGTSSEAQPKGPLKVCTEQDAARLVRNVMERFPDSDIALQWGQRFGINARGDLGLAMMSMQTFAEVAKHGERVSALFGSPYRLHHEVRGTEVWLMISYPGDKFVAGQPSPSKRFHSEAMFASYVTLIQTLLRVDGLALCVHMPGSPPAYEVKYRKYLAHDARFNAACFAMIYPASIMHMPIRSASRALATRYLQTLDKALQAAHHNQNVVRQIIALMESTMGAYPSIVDVASKIGMSERSLRRKLAAEGHTFHHLLNQVKIRHAQEQLLHPGASVDAVALMVGFSDAASFRKAFRRSTGMTPTDWRAQNALQQ